jgi:hypothetical protein
MSRRRRINTRNLTVLEALFKVGEILKCELHFLRRIKSVLLRLQTRAVWMLIIICYICRTVGS